MKKKMMQIDAMNINGILILTWHSFSILFIFTCILLQVNQYSHINTMLYLLFRVYIWIFLFLLNFIKKESH